MKRIVVDIDGVLAEWNTAFRDRLIKLGAKMRPFETPAGPVMWNWVQPYGATYEQQQAAWNFQDPEWWGNLEPHADITTKAKDLLTDLCWTQDVYFVTARPHVTKLWTYHWLQRLLPGVTASRWTLIVVDEKKHILAGLEPAAIIEDKPDTLVMHCGQFLHCAGVLVKRPYNEACGWKPMVKSTEEALEYVTKYVS